MADIFLSYATEDRDRIRPLVERFEDHGWSVWWDRRIGAGENFDRVIEREIDNAACIVVVWSRSSIESSWVRNEANEGLDREILCPVLLEDVRPPLAFRGTQAANLIGWPREPHDEDVSQLIADIHNIMGANNTVPKRGYRTTRAASPDGKDFTNRSPLSVAIVPFRFPTNDTQLESIARSIVDDLSVRVVDSAYALTIAQAGPEDQELNTTTIGQRRSVRYVLTGTLSRSDDVVRCSARLLDSTKSVQVWGIRAESTMSDPLAAQDSLVHELRGFVESMVRAERERIRKIPVAEMNPDELLIAAGSIAVHDRTSRDERIALVRRAIELDPTRSRSHANLAFLLMTFVLYSLVRESDEYTKNALQHADRALSINPNDPYVINRCSYVHRVLGDVELALGLAKRLDSMMGGSTSFALYPALIQSGRAQEVADLASRNPNASPLAAGDAFVLLGRYADAIRAYRKLTAHEPEGPLGWFALANALGHERRLEEAQHAVEKGRALMPGWNLETYEVGIRNHWRADKNIWVPLVAGIRAIAS